MRRAGDVIICVGFWKTEGTVHLLRGEGLQADIYSFGVVMWELCTLERPVRGDIRPVKVSMLPGPLLHPNLSPTRERVELFQVKSALETARCCEQLGIPGPCCVRRQGLEREMKFQGAIG